MGKVLIVDDLEDLRFSLVKIVSNEGYTPFEAATGAEALEIVSNQLIDLIFLDIGLPDINGIELISRIREITVDAEIVMLTGVNDTQTVVRSLKSGAVDYILKPFDLMEFKHILHRLMQSRLTSLRNILAGAEKDINSILGQSREILRLKEEINIASEVKAPVLITGETGTGKELVARAVYSQAKQKSGIFVKVDCGTLSASLIESELFGYEKGAFTDARSNKKGLVEMADGGTLFLDEIGNLPVQLQPNLLRLIEESTFRRVGGLKDLSVNVRIIAATNNDLQEEVAKGNFREDLFFRLNVIRLNVPPLRARKEDILLLADFFLHQFAKEIKKQIKGLAPEAEKAILDHKWPGNIRELKNCIEREVIYCRSEWLSMEGFTPHKSLATTNPAEDSLLPLDEIVRRHIQKVLAATNNNKTAAARILGISRTTLRDKLMD
ncbi:MAG: sigma-54 dependent transcriptional regulator [Proteobacteria bacterium]|nr:sigma-54 dependent transcriptional regulator [Pseudomonadota bacterium]MBU1717095.1 sigma-54 dependent transcriptional regulator [Pseudomonadota bacterium]